MTLAAEDLSFAYRPGRCAVEGVHCALEPGSVLGIVGPNGSGKSTLLRLMAGLLDPLTGAVLLEGRPLGAWPRRARARRLAHLPQRTEPAPGFTAAEIVAQGRYPHRRGLGLPGPRDAAVVAESLARMEATDLGPRYFEELSGGERQRVLLASILAQEALYLLLDEPTAALDLPHQAGILALLRGLAHVGELAVAVVLHDLSLAADYCDRLLLLSQGIVVTEGSPGAVLNEASLARAYGGARLAVDAHPRTGKPLVSVAPAPAAAEDDAC